jgi:hypothetical protein
MSEIDSFIESLRASIDALKKAEALTDGAEVPEEDRVTLERTQETLQSMSDRMYDLAMKRGTTRKIPPAKHIELKDREPEQ